MFKHDSVDIVGPPLSLTLVLIIGLRPDSLMRTKNDFQSALLVHKCNMALESWRIDESSTRHMNICQQFLLLMPWIFRRIHWTKLTFKYRKYKHPSWVPPCQAGLTANSYWVIPWHSLLGPFTSHQTLLVHKFLPSNFCITSRNCVHEFNVSCQIFPDNLMAILFH